MAKPREIYMVYVRAFRRGAGSGAIDQVTSEHEDPDIRRAWFSGYTRGRDGLREAQEIAKKLSGYEPLILRVQDASETLHEQAEFLIRVRDEFEIENSKTDVDVLGAVGIILRSIEKQSEEHIIRHAAGAALLLLGQEPESIQLLRKLSAKVTERMGGRYGDLNRPNNEAIDFLTKFDEKKSESE